MDEDTQRRARQRRKVPVPFTRNLNNHTTKAVMEDVRMEEERIPGMVKESTVWDVYNNEARKVDNELVKDWTASLNFLLVFVSLSPQVMMTYLFFRRPSSQPCSPDLLLKVRRCWSRIRQKSSSTLQYNISTA